MKTVHGYMDLWLKSNNADKIDIYSHISKINHNMNKNSWQEKMDHLENKKYSVIKEYILYSANNNSNYYSITKQVIDRIHYNLSNSMFSWLSIRNIDTEMIDAILTSSIIYCISSNKDNNNSILIKRAALYWCIQNALFSHCIYKNIEWNDKDDVVIQLIDSVVQASIGYYITALDNRTYKITKTLYDHINRLIPSHNCIMPRIDKIMNNYYDIDDYTITHNNSLVLSHSDFILIKIKEKAFKNIDYLNNTKISINSNHLSMILNSDVNTVNDNLSIKIDDDAIYNYEKYTEYNIDNSIRVNYFMAQLYIAYCYNNIDYFYLSWKADTRGRLYNINKPLTFSGLKYIRPIFTFYNDRHDKVLSSVDATASVYQIIGGIMLDHNLLLDTNVTNNTTSKNDIYTNVANKTREYLEINKEELCTEYISIYNNFRKTYGINSIGKIHNIDVFNIYIRDYNRKNVKKIVMTYAYNQSIKNMTYSLIEDYAKSLSHSKILFPIFLKIVRFVMKSLIALYPGIAIYKSIMSEINKKNIIGEKRLIFIRNPYYEVSQMYRKKTITAIRKYNSNRKKYFKVNKIVIGNDIDRVKNRIALSPNFIHNIDSILLQNVLELCINNNIHVIPVHDCFYTSEKNIDYIIKFYKQSYIEHIIKHNPIINLLDTNNIDFIQKKNTKIMKLYTSLHKNVAIDEIIKKIYESKWILC